ncbi:MAG: PASTA domain-containing protein [Clostridia bacterium]|nr:PASTA domain-containing protein [Clostridia bacterium]
MENMRKRLRFWRWTALLSVLLTLSVGWIVFDDLFSPFGEISVSVEIPDLCGLVTEEAVYPDWADVELEYRYDADTPSGVILSQSPRAGTFRKLSSQSPRLTLSLVVSLGEETVTLPELSGFDARESSARLREMGLLVETVTATGAYPAGTVYAMEPRAGTVVPVGTKVILSVSAGPEQKSVKVPDLIGLSRSDALVKLWTAELMAGDVIEEASSLPPGTVIRQSHQPATLVPAGTKITLFVSREIGDAAGGAFFKKLPLHPRKNF